MATISRYRKQFTRQTPPEKEKEKKSQRNLRDNLLRLAELCEIALSFNKKTLEAKFPAGLNIIRVNK